MSDGAALRTIMEDFVALYRSGKPDEAMAIIQNSPLWVFLQRNSSCLAKKVLAKQGLEDWLLTDFLFRHNKNGQTSIEIILAQCPSDDELFAWCRIQLLSHWKRLAQPFFAKQRAGDLDPQDPHDAVDLDPTFGSRASPPPALLLEGLFDAGVQSRAPIIEDITKLLPSQCELSPYEVFTMWLGAIEDAARRRPSRLKRVRNEIPWKQQFHTKLNAQGCIITYYGATQLGEGMKACLRARWSQIQSDLPIDEKLHNAWLPELWCAFIKGLRGALGNR